MPSDLDVYRSASVLIDHHGADALFEAAQRADAFLAEGNIDGYKPLDAHRGCSTTYPGE